MPAEIIPSAFCADYWAVFRVPSESTPGTVYTVEFGGGEGPAFCDCPAFKYSPEDDKGCKHITWVFKHGCFWNPQWYEGGDRKIKPKYHTNSHIPKQKCPRCKGPMVGVRIAV